MQFKPLADRVVVKALEEVETNKGGIIIPDTAKEKPMEGEVLAVGSGRRDKEGNRIPMEVKKGDRVLFSKYGGNEFKLGGEEHEIRKEDEVFGIIER